MSKIAIVGSHRGWKLDDSLRVQALIDEIVDTHIEANPFDFTVVSGGAAYVDTWGDIACRRAGYEPEIFLPDREKYGWPEAAFVRNKLIAESADMVYAFYSDKHRSPGTASTVDHALKLGKICREWHPETGLVRVY